jgi:hypothetical protein
MYELWGGKGGKEDGKTLVGARPRSRRWRTADGQTRRDGTVVVTCREVRGHAWRPPGAGPWCGVTANGPFPNPRAPTFYMSGKQGERHLCPSSEPRKQGLAIVQVPLQLYPQEVSGHSRSISRERSTVIVEPTALGLRGIAMNYLSGTPLRPPPPGWKYS